MNAAADIARFTVLVPGAAGSAAIDAIKCIRRSDLPCTIIATDRDPLAAGFGLSDRYYVTKPLDALPAFQHMLALITYEGVNVILPTCRSDSRYIALYERDVTKVGAVFAGSRYRTIELCDDKLAFWQATKNYFPSPSFVCTGSPDPEQYPCFVKPRYGAGSRHSLLCRNQDDWRRISDSYAGELIAQELLTGPEYSVDVFCDLDGIPRVAVPRERLAVSDGVCTRARVFHDSELEALAMSVAEFAGVHGPCCVQLKRATDGHVKLQELNPRIGGSSIVSAIAGVDFTVLTVRAALGLGINIVPYKEVTVVRYFQELVAGGSSVHH